MLFFVQICESLSSSSDRRRRCGERHGRDRAEAGFEVLRSGPRGGGRFWLVGYAVVASLGYGLVINARLDVFFAPYLAGAGPGTQEELVPDALRRAHAYREAGVDCVYPICLWEPDALRRFMAEVRGPVNVAPLPVGPSIPELAALGLARLSWGPLLHWDVMAHFKEKLATLRQ